MFSKNFQRLIKHKDPLPEDVSQMPTTFVYTHLEGKEQNRKRNLGDTLRKKIFKS